jgi:hypothetical protein
VRTDHRNQVIHAGVHGGDRLKHGHLGKRPETAVVVPVLWQQPVAFAVIGTLLAILAPVLGMLVLPVLLAVALVGPGIEISGQFGTLPLRFPGPLANLVGAETLGLDPGLRQKMTATMDTSTGAAHGSLLNEAVNLAQPLQPEE